MTELIARVDRQYPDSFALERFRGYAAPHTLTLDLEPVGRATVLLLTASTDYAFSSDNWGRPRPEVLGLMRLFRRSLQVEAKRCLEQNIVLPAYDFVVKAAHMFNVLDARGAIGVTERARFIGRVRGLAKGVAEAYLAQREALGFPLMKKKSEAQAAAAPAP